jgi:hypothetical protein
VKPHTNYVTLECDGKQVTAPFPVLAAAPEMYALLKDALKAIEYYEYGDPCRERILAVLKAVEGEA